MSDDSLVQPIVAGFMDAWNRHDPAAFAALFAPDADFTNAAGVTTHGRDKIQALHTRVFSKRFKDSHETADQVAVRWLTPDIAAVDVRWTLTGVRDETGAERPPRNGILSLIVARSANQWAIQVVHTLDLKQPDAGGHDAPPPPAGTSAD